MHKTRKKRGKNKPIQRTAIAVEVQLYNYGSASFGEPSKAQIQKLSSVTLTLRTNRTDYEDYIFVRCRMFEQYVILAVRFFDNEIDRASCQLLENWDRTASIFSDKKEE